MKIIMETDSYNDNRYGKPYIAECDEKAKAIRWGEWVGTAGHSGELEIHLTKSTIVMKGQKDFRNNRNSAPYYTVWDGEKFSEWTISKMEVIKKFRELSEGDKRNPLAKFSDEEIIEEIKRRSL